jgi:hypothetical protein
MYSTRGGRGDHVLLFYCLEKIRQYSDEKSAKLLSLIFNYLMG